MQPEIITIERLFDTPVEQLWKVLTDPEMMKQWYFDIPGFEARVGYKFQFTGGPSPDRQYKHLCEITEVIENSKLSYSWQYDGYEGISFVTFELVPDNEKTLLRLTHAGIETFPANNPDLAIHNFKEGWNHIVHISLKEYLEK